MNRYQTGIQGEYQPGSDNRVLANKLDITSSDEMDEVELTLLEKLYDAVLSNGFPDRALTVTDLKSWHRQWLGNIYYWAGEERSVNMAKNGFHFAAAMQVPRLLDKFEADYLRRFTPCRGLDDEALAMAIAITHVELILIHPFREGNGRLARLLADVMATQAGRALLDYSSWDTDKEGYFSAIRQGLTKRYEPMIELVTGALGTS